MNKKNNKLLYKYKINNIDNLFYNEMLKKKIKNLILSDDNIIFIGNSGSGKTSLINILKKKYKNYLQLSNFNSKGYDYIMSSINNYLKTKTDNTKLIIFDNLDNLSLKAQHIISEVLDDSGIKVIITCCNLCNIIEPIQSNCIIVKLLIEKEILIDNLKKICSNENIKYNNDDVFYKLIEIYKYDIRKIINIIDILKISFNFLSNNNIEKLLNNIDIFKLSKIINYLLDKKLKESIIIVNELLGDGYSRDDIMLGLIEVIEKNNIDNELKINLINIINKKYIILNEVINSDLQLYGCLANLCQN